MRAADVLARSPGAALRRVRLVAAHTLTEAVRLRLTGLLALGGVALVLLALGLQDFNFGAAELKFIADFGLGVISLLGTLLAALAMAHLHFRDLEGGLAACVLTRRVRRGEYLAGKLAGVATLLALFTAGLVVLLGVILAVRGAQLGEGGQGRAWLLPAGGLLWLKLTLVAAMTQLVCSYAGSALFASWAGLMLAVLAHLRPFTSAEGGLAWLRLWPNLGLFDAEPLLAGPGYGAADWLALGGYWGVFMALFGVLSAHVFRRREL